MRITWSPLALERASEAARYIAQDDSEAVERWVEGLFRAVEGTKNFPEMGRVVPEIGRPEFRQILYGNYRVIYRVTPAEVFVLTVRHTRRLFDPDDV